MKQKNIIFAVVAVALVIGTVFLISRKGASTSPAFGKIQAAASFYPLYFFASQIAGDKADVLDVTPAGAEPHDYEPSPSDMSKIENSRLVVLNGGGLEAWGGDLKQNIDPAKTELVIAGEGFADRQIAEGGKITTDPHVWLSPILAKQMVDKIAAGFIKIDSANQAYYLTNAVALKAGLDDLDFNYKAGLKNCIQKNIVTAHAAFGYLASAYGLNQVAITGLSPDAEPSPRQMADIVQFVKMNDVKYIFFESLVSPKLADTIAAETGAQPLILNPIEGLTNDQISAGKNYFTEMTNNLNNLKIALQCLK